MQIPTDEDTYCNMHNLMGVACLLSHTMQPETLGLSQKAADAIDDMSAGHGDLGCMGHPFLRSSVIRMAKVALDALSQANIARDVRILCALCMLHRKIHVQLRLLLQTNVQPAMTSPAISHISMTSKTTEGDFLHGRQCLVLQTHMLSCKE